MMALVDRVAAHRAGREARRSDPVTMEEFGYLLGAGRGNASRTKSGVPMGPQRALGISAWWRGVRYLTESVCGLPVFSYHDDTTRGRTRRVNPQWLIKPDVETPRFSLIELWMMSLLHRGNAYAYKLRNEQGQAVGLRGLHPDRVKPGRDPLDGLKVFQIDGRMDVGYTTREILHIPGLSYDGVCGLNPLQYHAESLGLIAAADEYAARSFGQGTHLRAYLSLPQKLTDEQSKELRAQWRAFHQGMANAHEVGVLGNGAEYKTVDLTPEQAQLLETRKFGVTDMARILGVPPHKLYDLERATFSNIEHQAIEAVTDSVRPWVERIEAHVNFDPDLSPAGNFIEFELEGLLRGDLKARYEAYSAGITGGFLMPSEPRHKENLEEIEGTRFLLRPLAMTQYGPDAPDEPVPELLAGKGATT